MDLFDRILIFSESTCPFFNLALEEYLVRNALIRNKTYLLLYQNQNAIVLGKNQNIFKEIHPNFWNHPDYTICRRLSGGGTVFHDLGNINISVIESKTFEKVNKYDSSVGMVQRILKQLGIETYQNDRNALFLKKNDKKISGCAQFNSKDTILSHLTLLVRSDLEPIAQILAPLPYTIQSKASVSFPSPVCNLSDIFPIEISDIYNALKEEFSPTQTLSSRSYFSKEAFRTIKNTISTFEYRIIRSCQCILDFQASKIEITSEKIKFDNQVFDGKNWENGFKYLHKKLISNL